MNEESTNLGGWAESSMREFLNESVFYCMPTELIDVIKPVVKYSDGGYDNSELVETEDFVWLASYTEVNLVDGMYNVQDQGSPYDSVFVDKTSRKKYRADGVTTSGWWLRSSYYSMSSSSMFWRVTDSGGSYGDIAFNPFYVAFGFCI